MYEIAIPPQSFASPTGHKIDFATQKKEKRKRKLLFVPLPTTTTTTK